MEMHLVRVILVENKAKEVLKMRKENKNSSKDKVTVKASNKDNMAVKADNRAETSKKASSKDKETVNNSKGKVTVKANSKSRMRRLSTKMEMHPVGVILEDGKVKGVLKQRKQSKNKNKGRVAANKAKSQQKTTVKRSSLAEGKSNSQQTTFRATKAMTRPAHLTSPRRDIPTCGRRIPSSRA